MGKCWTAHRVSGWEGTQTAQRLELAVGHLSQESHVAPQVPFERERRKLAPPSLPTKCDFLWILPAGTSNSSGVCVLLGGDLLARVKHRHRSQMTVLPPEGSRLRRDTGSNPPPTQVVSLFGIACSMEERGQEYELGGGVVGQVIVGGKFSNRPLGLRASRRNLRSHGTGRPKDIHTRERGEREGGHYLR